MGPPPTGNRAACAGPHELAAEALSSFPTGCCVVRHPGCGSPRQLVGKASVACTGRSCHGRRLCERLNPNTRCHRERSDVPSGSMPLSGHVVGAGAGDWLQATRRPQGERRSLTLDHQAPQTPRLAIPSLSCRVDIATSETGQPGSLPAPPLESECRVRDAFHRIVGDCRTPPWEGFASPADGDHDGRSPRRQRGDVGCRVGARPAPGDCGPGADRAPGRTCGGHRRKRLGRQRGLPPRPRHRGGRLHVA